MALTPTDSKLLKLCTAFLAINIGALACWGCSTPQPKRYVPDICYLSTRGLFCSMEKEAIAIPAAEGWACMSSEDLKLFLESERCR